MNRLVRYLPLAMIALALFGILDAGYLTYEHYSKVIPPCSIHWWLSDCGKVLSSKYSVVFGIPLALIGVVQYSVELVLAVIVAATENGWAKLLLVVTTAAGFISSLFFMYLMVGVIGAICWYCLGSAVISILLFATNSIYISQK